MEGVGVDWLNLFIERGDAKAQRISNYLLNQKHMNSLQQYGKSSILVVLLCLTYLGKLQAQVEITDVICASSKCIEPTATLYIESTICGEGCTLFLIRKDYDGKLSDCPQTTFSSEKNTLSFNLCAGVYDISIFNPSYQCTYTYQETLVIPACTEDLDLSTTATNPIAIESEQEERITKVATNPIVIESEQEEQITKVVTIPARSSDLKVIPNPFQEELTVLFESVEDQRITIELVDLVGRIIHQESFSCSKGKNAFEIQLSNKLPQTATYVLRLTEASGQFHNQKVVAVE